MIFVCTGSRAYQFNRLLSELDALIKNGIVDDELFAQIGDSQYEPKYYKWARHLDRSVFEEYQKKADLIISHGGVGALIGALKLGKQVIAVPRYVRFGEHIDDHQTQISGVLAQEGYLREVLDIKDLGKTIRLAKTDPIVKRYDRPSNIVGLIENFLSD